MAERRGPIAWMARNPVAANLLMAVLLVGGALCALDVREEVFPEVLLDVVTVVVPYPGAGPAEVEQGVVLAVEEAIRGVDGVQEIRATAEENRGSVVAELRSDADRQRSLNDIKNAVDRITSFPREAEEPIISLPTNRRQVLSIILHGDLSRRELDVLSEAARRELLGDPRIDYVEVDGLPLPQIDIEIPQANLRRYGLSPGQVASVVADASIELGGGEVKTPQGDVLLRTLERKDWAWEFENVTLIAGAEGTQVTVGDIGRVVEGFRDPDRAAFFNGQPAVRLRVHRVGDQTPLEVAAAVREYVERKRAELPEKIGLAIWNDQSEIYGDRVGLLLENARLGLILVLVVLGLFLEPRVAFWVTLGIPVTFLGVFLVMPLVDASINMISLFAFLLVLGIVVDDAIVVGEAIHTRQSSADLAPGPAAIEGALDVARPVVFAVLTTVLAFTPLLFVPGVTGEFFAQIPLIVIPILLLSLIESLGILPAHLSHGPKRRRGGLLGRLTTWQQRFSRGIEHGIDRFYRPLAGRLLAGRYVTLSAAVAILVVAAAYVASGRIPFHFLPKIEGELVTASVELPFGAPVERTREVVDRLTAAAEAVLDEAGGADAIARGIFAELGVASGAARDPTDAGIGLPTGGHLATVSAYLVPAGRRELSSAAFARRWREIVGEVPGVDRLAFDYSVGPPAGAKVAFELAHTDRAALESAAESLAAAIGEYRGVFDVDDGFQRGKPQFDLTLRPEARSLGLRESDLARQVRGAFFGAEATRQQRGRDELIVYVRRPENERESIENVENLMIRTPDGGDVPLHRAAFVERGSSYTSIEREDGRRVVEVTADVDPTITSGGRVTANVEGEVLPRLLRDVDGLSYELSGEQQERAESLSALRSGMLLALLAMYALMAVSFRSYAQPLLILLAIPFGLVGALAGHLLMGYDLSLVSIFGVVALSGVVVNDSLVLVSAANDCRARGESGAAHDAIIEASVRRFRPVVLTSLTTFVGLAPMIFETSLQARFLIPMALGLGFGVLFTGAIALAIVPAGYLVLEDLRGCLGRETDEARPAAG